MTSRHAPIARLALAALGLLLPATAAAQPPVGFVAAVRGFAQMAAPEGDFALAAIDRDVSVGDTVRTRDDGWLKMLLADDTTLAVDAESDLRVDRFGDAAGTHVTLRAGHVRAKVVDGFGRRRPMEMATPHATIVARGTEWLTWLDADSTWVCAVSGDLSVNAGSRSLAIAAGDCVQAAETLRKASRPRHLRAVAMRPGQVPEKASFPASAADADSGDPTPTLIDVQRLLRERAPEDRAEGRPPASAAIP